MPSWSRKDQRLYEQNRESNKDRGVGDDRAEEIAARTVNEQRREEGRTPDHTTPGTGNPSHGLASRTRAQLYDRAQALDIEGRSRMDKQARVRAIRDAQ